MQTTGVLLVGHGTRSELGERQFFKLAERVAAGLALDGCRLEPAFLELAEPTIAQGVSRLLGQGISRLIVAPVLLFAAGHAKEDVPRAVRQALTAGGASTLEVRQAGHFGLHHEIVTLACQRFAQAAAALAAADLQKTCLVVVGRGSRDPQATAEFLELARLIGQRTEVGGVLAGFVAMAQPSVEEVFSQAAQGDYSHVIVLPHLLFHGEILENLAADIRRQESISPAQQWRLARILGDDLLSTTNADDHIVTAEVDLIRRAL